MRRLLILTAAYCLASAATAAAIPFRDLKLGDEAPVFSLKNRDGKAHTLSDFKGAPLVLVYWRANQLPSKKLIESLGALADRFEGKAKIASIVHLKDGKFPKKMEIHKSIPVLLDPKREVYGRYGLFVLPTTMVLDKNLKIVAAYGSYQRSLPAQLEDDLRAALGMKKVEHTPLVAKIKDPKDSVANFARRLLSRGQPGRALSVIKKERDTLGKKVVRIPDHDLIEAEALIQLKRWKEARRVLEKLLGVPEEELSKVRIPAALSPAKGKYAAMLFGRALTETRQMDAAEAWLKESIQLNPRPDMAHYYLGRLYERRGENEKALAEYKHVLDRIFDKK
jgi:peroxiredoxin